MRTSRLVLFGAGLIAACSSSSHPSGPTTGVVHGVVTSSLGGGLTGLSVTVTPAAGAALPAVISGAGGAFSVLNVPLGSGSVSVSGQPALCARPSATAYSFNSGDSTVANVRVACTQPTGSIAGVVFARYGSNLTAPASGAIVTVTPTGGGARPPVTADANGNFQVDSIPLPVANGVAQNGGGTIVVNGILPAGCTPPVTAPYSGLADTNRATSPLSVVIPTACIGSTLTVDVTWPFIGGAPGFLIGPTPDDISGILFTFTASVRPGSYYVKAPPIGAANDSIVWSEAALHLSGTPVTLAPGASATIHLTYTEQPGTGQVWIASSRGASGYVPKTLKGSGIASGNTIPIAVGARAITTDASGDIWTTGSFGVAEYATASLPLRSGPYTPPSGATYTFALPHGSTGAAGMAFDAVGHLWVSDITNAAIYEYNVGSSTPVATISGPPLRAPIRIAFGDGALWVADTLAHSLLYYAQGASTPQVLDLSTIFPGGGPYAIAFRNGGDMFVGGATGESPAGQDSGLVAWYPAAAPQYITTPYSIWRFVGQSFAPGTSPARPPLLDLAADFSGTIWAIGNNGVVNFSGSAVPVSNANPPVIVASATDLSGLAFNMTIPSGTTDTSVTVAPTRVGPRSTLSRRGGLSRAAARLSLPRSDH